MELWDYEKMTIDGQEIIKLICKFENVPYFEDGDYLLWENKDYLYTVEILTTGLKMHSNWKDNEIKQGYYSSNISFQSVKIQNGVTKIGDAAFENCSNLTNVTIPDSVNYIGYSAFADCGKLQKVTIPSGVTNLYDTCFLYCESLSTVTIPKSVTSFGYGCFAGCTSLYHINYSGTIDEWRAIEKGDLCFEYGVPSTCIVHCSDGYINI